MPKRTVTVKSRKTGKTLKGATKRVRRGARLSKGFERDIAELMGTGRKKHRKLAAQVTAHVLKEEEKTPSLKQQRDKDDKANAAHRAKRSNKRATTSVSPAIRASRKLDKKLKRKKK